MASIDLSFKVRKESEGYRYWRDDEINFLTSNYKNMSARDIAIHLNRSLSSVQNRVHYLKIGKLHSFSDSDVHFIRCNLGKLSAAEIARKIGFSPAGVRKFCRRNNLCYKVFGDNHHNTIHSDEDFNFIHELYEEGVKLAEITSKFDIPYATVKSYLFKNKRRVASDYYLFID
ncbi:hypothetical protein RMG04_002944 [Salmonella enterica]|nr:hypothetical protein [Salmonella enterica]